LQSSITYSVFQFLLHEKKYFNYRHRFDNDKFDNSLHGLGTTTKPSEQWPNSTNREAFEAIIVHRVVPQPVIRHVDILLKDSLNAIVFYTTINQKDTFLQKISFNDSERIDLLHECFNQLSEIEEGWEVMPGKEPCVGMRGVNAALIYTTSDTTRFKISGTARCDNSLMPEWSLLDSLSTVLLEENKGKNGKMN
jgi:hypothetical protein